MEVCQIQIKIEQVQQICETQGVLCEMKKWSNHQWEYDKYNGIGL